MKELMFNGARRDIKGTFEMGQVERGSDVEKRVNREVTPF
jgi:hypothetical protein